MRLVRESLDIALILMYNSCIEVAMQINLDLAIINEYCKAQDNLAASREVIVKDFGKLLKDARSIYGWTQKQLGQLLGVDNTIICKIEAGSYTPENQAFFKIFKAIVTEAQAQAVNKVSP